MTPISQDLILPGKIRLFASIKRGEAKKVYAHLNLEGNLLALDTADDLARGVLGDDLVVVQHLKLLSGIAAHEVENSLDTAGVVLQPVGQVENNTLDNDPQILLCVVLGNLLESILRLGDDKGLGLVGLGSCRSSIGGLLNHSGGRARGGAVSPLDRHLARSRRVQVQGNLAQTLSSARCALESLLEEVVAGSVTGNTAVDDTAQQGRTTKTVGTVNTTCQLTTGEEAVERLLLLVEDLGLVVDLDTTHGEMENRLHEGDMEVIVDIKRQVVEETLAPWVLLLAVGNGVVGGEGLLEVVGSAANLLGQLLASHLLHEATAGVVTGVEIQGVGSLGVEDEADGELVLVLLLPHHTRDIITVAELVAETVAVSVEEETALTTESLSSQELPLGAGILGVDETSRVDLNLVHINGITANGHDHLLAVTSGVGAVGGGKAVGVGAVLLQERALAKVGSVATGGENDRAANGERLAIVLISDTGDVVVLLVQASDTSLLDNLDSVGLILRELFETLHESVSDGHTRELGVMASVGSGLRVATSREIPLACD